VSAIAVRLGLLGGVDATIDDRPVEMGHSRQRCALAVLLVEANKAAPVEHVLEQVWGERPPQRARNAVHPLPRLRQIFTSVEDLEFERGSGGYALMVDPAAVDMYVVHRLAAEAASPPTNTAEVLLERALGLWKGDAFGMLDTPGLKTVGQSLHVERFAVGSSGGPWAETRGFNRSGTACRAWVGKATASRC
jgi:DNA-binding SARP family transcriptional activator